MKRSLLVTAVLASLFAANSVKAEEATPTWTFPTTATLASDYIWHGQSQTWGNPALQFGIEADHASGFYAGFWGSNVSSHWLPAANLETDWSLGFRGAFLEDFKYDIGGTYIWYPEANFSKAPINPSLGNQYKSSKLDTLELYASLGWKWFTVKGGINPTEFYGWETSNSGANGANFGLGNTNAGIKPNGNTRGSGYLMASASYDVIEGLNVSGEAGRQMIADSNGLDWTWYKLGVTKALPNGFSATAFYTGTAGGKAYTGFASFDSPNAAAVTDRYTVGKSKIVFSISKAF